MIYEKPNATYVASVRCDIRDIASIALFFNNKGETLPTQTALVNMGVKMMGQFFQSRFPVGTYTDAIAILRNSGYGDPLKKGTRYFRGLLKELGNEELANMSSEMQSSADRTAPAPNTPEAIIGMSKTVTEIMNKDKLEAPKKPTEAIMKGAPLISEKKEAELDAARSKKLLEKKAKEEASGEIFTTNIRSAETETEAEEPQEEPSHVIDPSKDQKATPEEIKAANEKNETQTKKLREGLLGDLPEGV